MPQPDATASLPSAQPAKRLIGGGKRIRTAGPSRKTSRSFRPEREVPQRRKGPSRKRGTEGSNLLSSSGESGANLAFGGRSQNCAIFSWWRLTPLSRHIAQGSRRHACRLGATRNAVGAARSHRG